MILSDEQISDIVAQVATRLAAAGLVIVPADAVLKKNSYEAKKREYMARKEVSILAAEKYKLLPYTRKTIKAKLKEGIFNHNEVYKKNGRWYILTAAIKRHNKLLYNSN